MLAGIIIGTLAIGGLACELAAYVIGRIIARRQTAAPMYQDPQRAESDAWAAAYPEPNREDHS